MSDIISIVSGKGGTGKTITAANLSLALQEFGKQVVCLDTDLDSSNLGLQLGHTPDKNTLENYLRGDINELKAVNVHDSGLLFVPSSLHLTGDAVREDRLNKMIERFSGFTDHIVIDAPPGFNEGFYNSLKVSDRVLVVTNPEFQTLQDVMKITEEAGKHGTDIEGLVLNKLEGLNEETTQKEVETVTGLEVLQKIPYEKEVQKSVHRREPLVADPHSKVGHRFRELAARITGRKFEPPWYSGIVRNVKKLMGR